MGNYQKTRNRRKLLQHDKNVKNIQLTYLIVRLNAFLLRSGKGKDDNSHHFFFLRYILIIFNLYISHKRPIFAIQFTHNNMGVNGFDSV